MELLTFSWRRTWGGKNSNKTEYVSMLIRDGEKCPHPVNIHANTSLTLGGLWNSNSELEGSIPLEYIVKREIFKVGLRNYTNSANRWLLYHLSPGQQRLLSPGGSLDPHSTWGTLRILKVTCVQSVKGIYKLLISLHIFCITCTFWDIQYFGNQEAKTPKELSVEWTSRVQPTDFLSRTACEHDCVYAHTCLCVCSFVQLCVWERERDSLDAVDVVTTLHSDQLPGRRITQKWKWGCGISQPRSVTAQLGDLGHIFNQSASLCLHGAWRLWTGLLWGVESQCRIYPSQWVSAQDV